MATKIVKDLLLEELGSRVEEESLDTYIISPVTSVIGELISRIGSLSYGDPGATHSFYSAIGSIYGIAPSNAGSIGTLLLYINSDSNAESIEIPTTTQFVDENGNVWRPMRDYVVYPDLSYMNNAGSHIKIDVWCASESATPGNVSIPGFLSHIFREGVVTSVAPRPMASGRDYVGVVLRSIEFPAAARWVASVADVTMIERAGEGEFSPDEVYDVSLSLISINNDTFVGKVRNNDLNPNRAMYFIGEPGSLIGQSYADLISMEEVNQIDYSALSLPDDTSVTVNHNMVLDCYSEIRSSLSGDSSTSPCYDYQWIYPFGIPAEKWYFGESGMAPGNNIFGSVYWDAESDMVVFRNKTADDEFSDKIGEIQNEARRAANEVVRRIRQDLSGSIDPDKARQISEQVIRVLMSELSRLLS